MGDAAPPMWTDSATYLALEREAEPKHEWLDGHRGLAAHPDARAGERLTLSSLGEALEVDRVYLWDSLGICHRPVFHCGRGEPRPYRLFVRCRGGACPTRREATGVQDA